MVSAWELPVYAVLGVVAAVVALAFIYLLYKLEDLFEAIPVPFWTLAPVGGALVGAVGVFYPQVFGVGYEAIEQALRGELALGALLILLLLKVAATGVTIGSGGSGGVFAPSLFIGAMTGGLVGTLANQFFPSTSASAGAYALVGMGAVVAGSTHAPITAILIIFELTNDYKLIVPLMAACIVSTLLTTRWKPESIYTMKLIRRGIDIRRGRDVNVLRSLFVRDVMSQTMVKVDAGQPFGELVGQIATHAHECFYVVGSGDRLRGVIVLAELREVVLETNFFSDALVAADVAREDVLAVSPDQDLDTVSRLLHGKNRQELPVVDTDGKLVGVVSRRHLLNAYSSELQKREMVSTLSSSLDAASHDDVHLGEDYRMGECDAPGELVGRSIRGLDVRARYGVQILLLRRPSPVGGEDTLAVMPEPETVVERGDRLVLLGREGDIKRLRAL
jgi:CIC family chloride channel protein